MKGSAIALNRSFTANVSAAEAVYGFSSIVLGLVHSLLLSVDLTEDVVFRAFQEAAHIRLSLEVRVAI